MKNGGQSPFSFMKIKPLPLLLGVGAVLLAGCAVQSAGKPPLRTVSHVDLPRYMGDWRVIANIPYFAERGCVDSIEAYALRPDGTILNTFTFRKHSLDAPQQRIHANAKVFNPETNAEWRVTFFGLIRAKYFIIGLDPDYQWALVAHPSRKYGWVLARGHSLPEAKYRELLAIFAAQGYDISRFRKVPQSPGR